MYKDEMTEDEKCCFCGTQLGALVRLWQGWCCVDCFQKLLDSHKEEGKKY